MGAPKEVVQLVERFERNLDAYRRGTYNETQVRHEFIDPLFIQLGWDVNNERGYAEAYKDVIHEDAIKVGGATKAPDYCFRIGGTRKFFLEAKKPSVDISAEAHPAYQLRRYAWSAKLPLSILTDFDEFATYDCRVKPEKTDKASVARTIYMPYTKYIERWEEIASIFSRDAVLKGSFDKYVESTKVKKGTAEVDDAFLREIESWREMLARHIALRNPRLTQRELNFAVQRTIDRLIFLRICEDRGVEIYGQLHALVNGGEVYDRLREIFYHADERYNSGLFHFHKEKDRAEPPDELTPNLTIDDAPLKEIIRAIYYPDSPYEFSVLPADILGQVYEQFLGKVIRLTAGHRAVVEDKPEVKKAGGVYYTPTYIVDYIVKNTVGEILRAGLKPASTIGKRKSSAQAEGLTPREVAKIRILDPACGSGSFLIGAYQYLLDWHRDWYVNNGLEEWAKGRSPKLYQAPGGDWRLTSPERKRILLNNIYGVDIDPQAVEVTKLSLLLKVLEGESAEVIGKNLQLFHERALPDLGNNIKCGNSLIGPDFYEIQQLELFDEEERYRINVFDWDAEFPKIMKSGGFDVVIGNPPYVRMEGFKKVKHYLKDRYEAHDERSDIYVYFIERAHALLRKQGHFGMIVSNKFLRANYGRPLRQLLRRCSSIDRIVDFAGLPVFAGATVRTVVLLTSRGRRGRKLLLYSPPLALDRFVEVQRGIHSVAEAIADSTYEVPGAALDEATWSLVRTESANIFRKLEVSCQPLGQYCEGKIYMGIKSGLTSAFVIDGETRSRILRSNPEASEIIKPFLNGRNVRRYVLEPEDIFLIYAYHGVPTAKYPAVRDHLQQFRSELRRRVTKQQWYELQQPQYRFAQYMEGDKIIFPDIATAPRFALDDIGYYCSNTTYFIPARDLYLLALLNSRLGYFYFAETCAGLEGKADIYLRFFGQYLQRFPVRSISSSNCADKARHGKMVELVETMLSLHKKLAAAKTDHDKTAIQRQIDATDRQIDQLVYDLYELTDEEIKIVEEATAK